jgi:GNAT superfamily N-acetyltransferase
MSSIEVRQVDLGSSKDVETFINVPWDVGMTNEKNWVPPLKDDYRKQLNPKKSVFLAHGELAAWTAFRDGKPVGRISAQVDFDYDKTWPNEPKTCFFGFFESLDDQAIAKALFEKAEAWARSKGRVRLRGPITLDTKGEVGILVEGFENPSMIGTTWNRPFMDALIQACGYGKAKDFYGWLYDANTPMDAFTKKVADKTRALPNVKIRLMELAHLRREAGIIKDIYNEAWRENWNFTPFTDLELEVIASEYKMFIDEQLAYVAEVDGKPAAMLFAIPDVNELIRDFNGELMKNPINLIKLLWRLKFNRPKKARLIMLGVHHDYRASRKYGALAAVLYEEISMRGRAAGYVAGELSWTLEDNDGINRGIERMGAKLYKRWRVYERPV